MKINNRLKTIIMVMAGCLVLTANIGVFAESNSQPAQPEAAQPAAAPQTVLGKADFDEIQRIVDESVGNKTRPLIREIAKLGQGEEAGFKEIVGGVGYIFGIIGVIMFFLGRKEGKS